MKKVVLSVYLFLGVLFLSAQTYQYVPLVNSTNKTWLAVGKCTLGFHHFSCGEYYRMYGDTVFDGYVYKKVFLQGWSYFYALLETQDRKVYGRDLQFNSTGLGRLIYDFSVNEGDTLNDVLVLNVDTVLLQDSTLRRKIFLSDGDVWIEGIGSIKYALFRNMCVCDIEGAMCWVKEDSTLIYSDNNSYCAILAVDDQLDNSTISVYPNPIIDDIHVTYLNDVFEEDAKFCLYNIAGKEIFSIPLHKRVTDISAADLQSGLYIWQVTNSKGLVRQGKLIRE